MDTPELPNRGGPGFWGDKDQTGPSSFQPVGGVGPERPGRMGLPKPSKTHIPPVETLGIDAWNSRPLCFPNVARCRDDPVRSVRRSGGSCAVGPSWVCSLLKGACQRRPAHFGPKCDAWAYIAEETPTRRNTPKKHLENENRVFCCEMKVGVQHNDQAP